MPPKKKSTSTITTNSTTAPQPVSLQWPSLTLPYDNPLEINTFLPEQILTIPSFFPAALCKTYLNFLRSLPLTTLPGIPKRGEAVRVNDRFQIDDAAFSERLWVDTGLKDLVLQHEETLWGGKVLGLNSNIRVYRYLEGMFFDKHYDDTNTFLFTDPATQKTVPSKTTWTLLIYVTGKEDNIVGGETVFYTEATKKQASETIVADFERGTALLHRHGNDCMLHEGRKVEKDGGVGKWVLRSDLVVRR